MDIELVDYSEKSVVLAGEGTRLYKDEIQKLTKIFNYRLKYPEAHEKAGQTFAGWVISKSKIDDVNKLMDDISARVIAPVEPEKKSYSKAPPKPPAPAGAKPSPRASPRAETRVITVPTGEASPPKAPAVRTRPGPASDPPKIRLVTPTIEYQEITYRCIKPAVGMKINLTMDGVAYTGKVTQAPCTQNGIVDRIIVTPDNDAGVEWEFVIISGEWKNPLLDKVHTVAFSV